MEAAQKNLRGHEGTFQNHGEHLASRDPVSGTAYYVMLGVFCIIGEKSNV